MEIPDYVAIRTARGNDDRLTGGVHNTFIHDGHVYALSAARRYDIISIEDPAAPRRVGSFALDNPARSIHDVVVRGGWVHILEWDEFESPPRLVARYEVPEAGSHNIWVEDDVMYVAFYNGGLRVVDVSGELLGNLYRQGREIARFLPLDPEGFVPNAAQVFGAQPHKGTIFFSDMNSGLWAVRLGELQGEETTDQP